MVIALEVTYINITTYIKMDNLFPMFKLRLNRECVQYVYKKKNKNLSKVDVAMISVYNVIKNYLGMDRKDVNFV